MLDDALPAELLHGPVAFHRDEAVLDVELPQASAVVGDGSDPFVRHELAALHAQLLQVGAVLREEPEAPVRDVALAQVQSSQAGAGPGEDLQRVVAHGLATSQVQVAELVAMPADLLDPSVRDLVAFRHGEVAEVRAQSGQLVHPKVRHLDAVRDAQLFEGCAIAGQVFDPHICVDKKKKL